METDKNLRPELNRKEYDIKRQLIIYTLLFVIAALGAYSFYIIGGSVFVTNSKTGNKDGITQIIPSYLAVKHIVQGVLAGEGFSAWTWSIGLGGDNWNMFASKLANPFTYMIIAFPEDKIDIGYTIVSIFRQYCVGIAFMTFGHKVRLTVEQNVLGALCYAFSMWMIMTIPDQAGFNTAALLFPLLMLGTEKIIDNESPLIFIISVFYFLTAGVVWGYASGIMIIFYFFLRVITNGELKDLKRFFNTTGRFMLSGIAGVLVAAFFVAEILMSMSAATTDTGSGKEAWFSLASYLAVPKSLYTTSTTGATSYSGIGLPIVGILLMPIIVGNVFRGKIEAIMSFLLLMGTQIPAVCRMFNGFSYASGRWFYMVAFFTTWAAMAGFSNETFRSWFKCIIMELWMLLTAGWIYFRYYYLEMDNRKTALAAIVGLVFGTLIIVLGHIKAITEGRAKERPGNRLISRVAMILIFVITVADIAEIGIIDSYTHAHDGVSGHAYAGESYSDIMDSSETAMPEIQDQDTDFYRYSRMGGHYGIRVCGTVINTSIAIGTRPIYTGFSSAPSAWHEFNRVVGNASGAYRRTLVDGNDNRAMLDYLMGVKYFLGSPTNTDRKKNKRASLYVPYGYGNAADTGKYELFTNTHCMGLGTSYPQYITESELMDYPLQSREQVLMEAAIVPDEQAGALKNVKHALPNEINIDDERYDVEITSTEGITVYPDKKLIEVRNTGGYIEVKAPNIKNRQILFTLRSFTRIPMGYADFTSFMTGGYVPDENDLLFKDKVAIASYKDKQSFKISTYYDANGDGSQYIKKGTKCEADGVRGFNGLSDFDINLGYFDEFSGSFRMTISNPGIYSYQDIALSAISMNSYDENANYLDSRKFEISEWGDDFAKGTMSCEEDSIMYFSILRNKGWHIYVDGEEVEKIQDVNISFTGAVLPAGKHQVELRYMYPYKNLLIAATIAGLLLTIGIMVVYVRKK